MGRINQVLDEDVDYGFEGGPRYSTDITEMENGFEERDSEWIYARHEYSASFGDINDDVRDHIIEVYHACRGRRHSFLFKDWNDYLALDQPLATEQGTSNVVQLYKTYEWGDAYTVRPIQALRPGTVVVRDDNGDPVAGTVDVLTGLFTPTSAWGAGPYTWEGEFYVWVRFDADFNPMTINSWRANTARVELVEDKFAFTATNVPASWEE